MQIGLLIARSLFMPATLPEALTPWSAIGLVGFWLLIALLGVRSGLEALRGKRRGQWTSLLLFGGFGVLALWGLFWSAQVIGNPDLEPLARASVIGYAVLGNVWILSGLDLQAHAICRPPSRG